MRPPSTSHRRSPPSTSAEVHCRQGRCTITNCATGRHDLNGDVADGCECVDQNPETTGNQCSAAASLPGGGSLSDAGSGSMTILTGNLAESGDEDWYTFTAVDSPDDTCDKFHVRVELTNNPSNEFAIQVFEGSCTQQQTAPLPCGSGATLFLRRMDYWDGGVPPTGECPCRVAKAYCTGPSGEHGIQCGGDKRYATQDTIYNHCLDDTQVFYVRVYRALSPATCAAYELSISNGRVE